MTDGFLVLNAGSSSLKFAVYVAASDQSDGLAAVLHGSVAGVGQRPSFKAFDAAGQPVPDTVLTGREGGHADVLARILNWIESDDRDLTLVAAGHRIVHGGQRFRDAVRIDSEVFAALEALTPLAPRHQPHNLAPVRALWERHPDLLQVACLDTAFHRTQPDMAQGFALPRDLTEAGIRRYGFHGLSYEYIASVLPSHAGTAAEGRVVVAHLGHGASMCALHERRSIATTMGFTALDGLPMAQRCGNLDPGVILYLLQQKGWQPEEVADLLYKRSGLYGVSGLSDDMADLLASEAPEAEESITLFCYRASRELGSLAAALGGLDVLVFTAGIGENAPEIRRRIAAQATWLGVDINDEANRSNFGRISTPASRVGVYVIGTDEARIIARHTQALCGPVGSK